MNVDLKNHLELHLPNPHLNFILSHNCKYCKLDRRLQYGKLFQKPRYIPRNNLNSSYYSLHNSLFTTSRTPYIPTSYPNTNNVISNSLPTPLPPTSLPPTPLTIVYNPDDYLDIEDSEPQELSLSINQLNNSSEVSIYLRGDSKVEKCTICYDNLQSFQIIRTLNCQHKFHQKCIDKWLENKINCPVCRSNI